ncbi:MAG: sigma-54-dependent Fis family transcriptional regulator [Planctomycetaceae bacterium]|nr:sigma-54-dependent Fis family transcriptional regulator [Planctomycetaceae bacterium]
MAKVLVVDDEDSIIWVFRKLVEGMGHQFLSAATGEKGIELARAEQPDLVFMDVKLPGIDGLAALEEVRRVAARTRTIVMTAHGSLDTAVRAMKLGAVEHLSKPVDLEQARTLIQNSLKGAGVNREVESLRKTAGQGGIVGRSPQMQEVFKKVAAVAGSEASVLLLGESGTGKELLARAVHYNSARASGPFEAINCASIPETLLESELFGHEKGAFTGAVRQKPGKFEVAGGGTVFLDEVGEISPAAQVKLLRFLEERKFERVGGTESVAVDVRIVSATNQNLDERVREGRFREDLYFRLNVVRIDVPPLRDRRDDLPLLVAYFLDQARGAGITTEALERIKNHAWPGNVRELRNAIERGAVLARGTPIRPEHLPETVTSPRPLGESDVEARVRELVEKLVAQGTPGDLYRLVESRWEKALIRRVLEQTGSNQVKAAELLGINRMTLRKKMELYGL